MTRNGALAPQEKKTYFNSRINNSEVHFSLLPTIKSRLSHRKHNLGMYKTLIRPVLSYYCEAWTVTESSSQGNLAMFERKILTPSNSS